MKVSSYLLRLSILLLPLLLWSCAALHVGGKLAGGGTRGMLERSFWGNEDVPVLIIFHENGLCDAYIDGKKINAPHFTRAGKKVQVYPDQFEIACLTKRSFRGGRVLADISIYPSENYSPIGFFSGERKTKVVSARENGGQNTTDFSGYVSHMGPGSGDGLGIVYFRWKTLTLILNAGSNKKMHLLVGTGKRIQSW